MSQLEAANRQLRSTRSFVEEQASEREAERDEFARTLQALRDENTRLAARLQSNAAILTEVSRHINNHLTNSLRPTHSRFYYLHPFEPFNDFRSVPG